MNFCFFKVRIGKILKGLLLGALAAAGYLTTASGGYVKVVDGDSLEIGARRIRLVEIDAPEYKQYCFDANGEKYSCGKDALFYLKDMLKASDFKVSCHMQGKDRYGRELSECFAGGKNLNLEMVKAGYAVTYRSQDEAYLQAERDAKTQKKGIWKGKFMRPEYFRRLQRREKR